MVFSPFGGILPRFYFRPIINIIALKKGGETPMKKVRLSKDQWRLIWVFKAPIILPHLSDEVPDGLRRILPIARIKEVLEAGVDMASNVDAAIYLSAASLNAPLDSDWADIFLYTATVSMEKYAKVQVPPDIRITELSDYQQRLLREFKEDLYERGLRHLKKKLTQEEIERVLADATTLADTTNSSATTDSTTTTVTIDSTTTKKRCQLSLF